jgi:hypothetical protein
MLVNNPFNPAPFKLLLNIVCILSFLPGIEPKSPDVVSGLNIVILYKYS